MVNPDNFIFHSDFWYPTGYISGKLELKDVPVPATFELSDQYMYGDYYTAQVEMYDGNIGSRFLGFTSRTTTNGSKLLIYIGSQIIDGRFDGTIHWRIYPKRRNFNFISIGRMEETVGSFVGKEERKYIEEITIPIGDVPKGKYFVRGLYRSKGGEWSLINTPADMNTAAYFYYNQEKHEIGGYKYMTPLTGGDWIEYNLQLVNLDQDSPFVFNSNIYSFAIPMNIEVEVKAPGSRSEYETFYGDWIDLPGEKVAYDVITRWKNNIDISYLNGGEMNPSGSLETNSYAFAIIQRNGQKIRPVFQTRMPDDAATFQILIYQNNNST